MNRAQRRYQRLIRKMWDFYRMAKASDCAGLAGQGESTQYTHKHEGKKPKGKKSQPRDYDAVEMLIDFKIEMDRSNYDSAAPLYYSLIRLLNWAE